MRRRNRKSATKPLPPMDMQITITEPPEPLSSQFEGEFRQLGDYFGAVRTDITRADGKLMVCWWFDILENFGQMVKFWHDNGLEIGEAGVREVIQ